ncbi:MAG: hypothetical protein ABIF92_01180 [archaeon]
MNKQTKAQMTETVQQIMIVVLVITMLIVMVLAWKRFVGGAMG